jgi:hypothetical protein
VIQLVDDQLLSGILRGAPPPDPDADLFTSGYWYVRLCQAVLGAAERTGVLSGPFARLPHPQRERATQSLIELPESIGLLSLRALAPTIGQLRQRHDLNILGMEALAAATHLQADVYLSAASPRLEAAIKTERLRVEIKR